MVTPVKVSLLVNSEIGPDIVAGPGREGYELAKSFFEKGLLGKVYCYSRSLNCDLPADKVVPFCRSWWKRRVFGLLNRVHRRYPVIRGRRRTEQWMDAFYARQLKAGESEILYCPKPLYPRSIRRAKALGMAVVVETSVLHPRFNLEVVGAERRRLGIHGAAGYTDERRVCNIEAALYACDKIFAWNSFVRDSYTRRGIPEDKFLGGVEFSPPGIDLAKYSPDADQSNDVFTVLHVSSISVIKGVQYLLDAWESLADEVDGRLIIVGPADRDMRRILAKRKIQSMEWVGRALDAVPYYKRASVFVSPSISDAGPRTVLESMACGTPVLVSDHCGASELVEQGENGFTYRYNDVQELAERLKWSCHNRARLTEMGRRARDAVSHYSVSNYSDEVERRLALVSGVVKCI